MIGTQCGLLFLFLFAVLRGVPAAATAFDEYSSEDPETQSEEIKSDHAIFELSHPESLRLNPEAKSLIERYRELIRKDGIRHRVMRLEKQRYLTGSQVKSEAVKNDHKNRVPEVLHQFEMKLRSGADYMTGQYLTHFRLGTPFQKMMLAMDTGSSLTWVKCKYKCGHKCNKQLERKAFHAELSPSFKPILCSEETCKELYLSMSASDYCPTPKSPCMYNYR